MKAMLFGKNSQDIKELVEKAGFEIISENPDVIISYGGDGTLFSAEREYQGIPKLPIRNSRFCNKCSRHEDKKVLEDLLAGKLNLKEYRKLHTKYEGKDYFGLNDFVIRNEYTIHAIRFRVLKNDIVVGFYIGDGVVITTPFGSTGYYKSITNETLKNGFALAFNNVTEKEKSINLGDDDTVGFSLVRGKAILTFDNNPKTFNIPEGKTLTFNLSDQVAKIYESSLRCPNCEVIRG